MGTLLLRLAAPLQSWGDESKFDTRRTWHEPSKSAVIGLLAAALGYNRADDERIRQLNSDLKFGVRVDQPGRIIKDFHTVVKYKQNELGGFCWDEFGKFATDKSSYVTYRYYLSDAVFVIGLEAVSDELLELLRSALSAPAFPLFLGRRSCPPTLPLYLGVSEEPLLDALRGVPWQAGSWWQKKQAGRRSGSAAGMKIVLHILSETEKGQEAHGYLRDSVISFNPYQRRYAERPVVSEDYEMDVACPNVLNADDEDIEGADPLSCTDHDCWTEAEEG